MDERRPFKVALAWGQTPSSVQRRHSGSCAFGSLSGCNSPSMSEGIGMPITAGSLRKNQDSGKSFTDDCHESLRLLSDCIRGMEAVEGVSRRFLSIPRVSQSSVTATSCRCEE